MGIYKRKQENMLRPRKRSRKKEKKERRQALDQESDQEKTITVTKNGKKTRSPPRK